MNNVVTVEGLKARIKPDDSAPLRAKSSYLQNSVALISGKVLSQAIVVLVSPLLARLFTPADFGHLASYNAWVAILLLFGNLRYEHAIIISPGKDGTNRVLSLTLALSAFSSAIWLLIAGGIYVFDPEAGYLREIRDFVLFIPVSVLLASVTSVLIQYNIKLGQFKRLAGLAAIQVMVTVAVQVAFGILNIKHGLIFGAVAGFAFSAPLFALQFLKTNPWSDLQRQFERSRLRATARRYINFPKYALPADAVTVAVQQFVPVLVLALFNPTLAGLYAFSARVVRVPLIVIGGAVTGSLRKEAVDRLREVGDLRRVFGATVKNLFLLGLVPFVVMLLFSTRIFAAVFGDQWVGAGKVVQILSPGILLEFVAFPLAVIYLVTNRQKHIFRIQAAGFAGLLAALLYGRFYLDDFITTCYLISAVMVVANATIIVMGARISGEKRSR